MSTAAENEEFMFGNANACPRLKQMFNSTWEHIKSNAEKDEVRTVRANFDRLPPMTPHRLILVIRGCEPAQATKRMRRD